MGDLISKAGEIIAQSQRAVDVAAQNIANIQSSGYRRKISFQSLCTGAGLQDGMQACASSYVDYEHAALTQTGSPLDLAISGSGFFVTRADGFDVYTRQSHFHRDAEGRLISAEGLPLQSASRGDLRLKDGEFTVAPDGTVAQAGEEVGRIAVVEPNAPHAFVGADGGFRTALGGSVHELEAPVVHQGMVEPSNVSNSKEMTSIVEAMRRAESGQQIAHVYDDLLGKAISGLGG